MQNIDCERLELDEIWTFNKKKQRKLRGKELDDPTLGDQFLFLAVDPDSKTIVTWYLGKRTRENAREFLSRLRFSLNGCRPQISTDEWKGYSDTIGGGIWRQCGLWGSPQALPRSPAQTGEVCAAKDHAGGEEAQAR